MVNSFFPVEYELLVIRNFLHGLELFLQENIRTSLNYHGLTSAAAELLSVGIVEQIKFGNRWSLNLQPQLEGFRTVAENQTLRGLGSERLGGVFGTYLGYSPFDKVWRSDQGLGREVNDQ